ncbi:MAG: ribonuclease Y [Chloroflexi bacterium RBG_16_48_8]|nr:MAG: ribonuclease Y [Chloroflexi bacterium RBG_16_48_8]
MGYTWTIIIGLTALVSGVLIGFFIRQFQLYRDKKNQQAEVEGMLEKAHAKARELELRARDEALRYRDEAEAEISRRRAELNREEERVQSRREDLDKRLENIERRDQALNKRQSSLDRRSNELEKQHNDIITELERISSMTQDEAKVQLLEEVERDARADMLRIIRQIEEEAQMEGERRARELIADAIQRVASDHVSEVTVSIVPLPSDDMKGRIIGRNGRNIRAFEQAAGVDVVVDDTPEAVTISCFDPVRREVARKAMEKLVLDGRIHPAHIEKILEQMNEEVQRVILEEGESAAYDAGVPGLHPEIVKKLGRLKFRTSYGQNQLAHAVETAQLAGVIAAELGADPDVAKAGGLLHDIGKAMDHEVEGTHSAIGAEFCRRHGVNEKIINTIASHHHETEQESVEAVIVEAADAISGARPGARRESLEQYIKRIKALEEVANSFTGVSESYALQAGREIRVIVKPDDIDDLDATRLARDVAKKIEEGMQYPGQIKVTVIRETRAVDYAK